ncbi:Hypp7913 [Branchiostoma lanceolatum]|uniref:Hypp7913 protein n=1 Tax=Branchiostoma lanceolatum TaxID=7740 RepID=A0A8K0EE13_BRALA|nr:Hypp7913 [Branchiostoma lanceolatum]
MDRTLTSGVHPQSQRQKKVEEADTGGYHGPRPSGMRMGLGKGKTLLWTPLPLCLQSPPRHRGDKRPVFSGNPTSPPVCSGPDKGQTTSQGQTKMSPSVRLLGALVLLMTVWEAQAGFNKLSKEDRLDCYIKCNQCKLLFTWPKPFSSTNCRQQSMKSNETIDKMYLSVTN